MKREWKTFSRLRSQQRVNRKQHALSAVQCSPVSAVQSSAACAMCVCVCGAVVLLGSVQSEKSWNILMASGSLVHLKATRNCVRHGSAGSDNFY
jgi:hypothetical protein